MHRMITMHARVSQRDRQRDGQMDRQTNIVAIARRFVLTNASRANDLKHVLKVRCFN